MDGEQNDGKNKNITIEHIYRYTFYENRSNCYITQFIALKLNRTRRFQIILMRQ